MSRPDFDLVLSGALLHPMSGVASFSGSVGIRGDRIVAVENDLGDYSATKSIDARGMTLLPGFNDVHCHTTWFGLSLEEINCEELSSLDGLYGALTEAASSAPSGTWIIASRFNQASFGGLYPDISLLNTIAPHHPIFIRHASGHSCIVNTYALNLAGLNDGVGQEGGAVITDHNGEFTGVLEERAQERVQRLFLPQSQSSIVNALDRATSVYASEGVTSFTEAGIGGGWIGHSPIEVAAYQEAKETQQLHARAQLMIAMDVLHEITGHADDTISRGIDLGIRTGFGDDWVKIGPTKVFLDGSLLGLTAAVHDPFCHGPAGNVGYFQDDVDIMRQRILDSYASGWSIAAHAIGDRAVDLALELFSVAQARHGTRRVPNRIEHGGIITNAHLSRIAGLGVVVVPQPGFIQPFGAQMTSSLGQSRVELSYRAKSLLDAGITLPGGSDRPVADGRPLKNIQAYVERTYGEGLIYGPDERITVEQALHAYTRGSAVTTGESDNRGSIEPGKYADFVLLEHDPVAVAVDEISSIQVVQTIVGGRASFDRL
jgi:predicted amidohydrolase YtcJ